MKAVKAAGGGGFNRGFECRIRRLFRDQPPIPPPPLASMMVCGLMSRNASMTTLPST